jgi:hypothetical protein
MNPRDEDDGMYITIFAEGDNGLMMRCHHCHDEVRLGFGDWEPGAITAKAAKHYCFGGWV